ncbi:unnamed protein product [Bemisia tabaci]|uniref:Pacifastin domain-containing protein n=1 Tax=Bemisia tabaci TaxID=7038 RepID=A0A9P0A6X6_BEMTA|nr:unnamed protein product [Bemisia tabaci]
MIRQQVIVLSLAIVCSFAFVAGKDTRESSPQGNGDNQETGPGSPVLQLLSQMMSPNAKSASLKELQKRVESDRTHIQKIPPRNREKQELEEKKKELEEKERELEENFVVSPDFDKYAYKSPKRSSVTYSIDATCQLATCYEDGRPFLRIHNYCYKGISDLQAACEERYLSARNRRAGKEMSAPSSTQMPTHSRETCSIDGETWKDNCNTCVCLAVLIPACTRMKCPEEVHPNIPPSQGFQPNGQKPNLMYNNQKPEGLLPMQNGSKDERPAKHIKNV